MPQAAARACYRPGCNGHVRQGVCNKCGVLRAHGDRALDQRRGSASQRGYDHTWRKLRRMQLAREPLCYDCKQRGVLTVGAEVHHIQALRDGGLNEMDNLMTLCKPCHSRRTNRGE